MSILLDKSAVECAGPVAMELLIVVGGWYQMCTTFYSHLVASKCKERLSVTILIRTLA
jgi:hypothetical protein